MISAATTPMKSEVRPPYISRTISSRPSRPSAPRKNLPPAPSHSGPIGVPFGADDVASSRRRSLIFSVSVVRRSARCRRRGSPRAAPPGQKRTISDEEADEGERDPVAPQPPVGEVPGAAPDDLDLVADGQRGLAGRHRLRRRQSRCPGFGRHQGSRQRGALRPLPIILCCTASVLALELEAGQSRLNIGLKSTLSKLIRSDGRSRTSRSRTAPRPPAPCISLSSSAYWSSTPGSLSCFVSSSLIFVVQRPGCRSGRSCCCWSAGCFRRTAAARRSRSGAGSPGTSRANPVSRSGVFRLPIVVK